MQSPTALSYTTQWPFEITNLNFLHFIGFDRGVHPGLTSGLAKFPALGIPITWGQTVWKQQNSKDARNVPRSNDCNVGSELILSLVRA
jgi:hypothetical protein